MNSGADEPVTIKLNTALSGDTGLDSKGFDVMWVSVDATHTNGVAINDANRVVFTLVENPVGTFTFTLLDQIDHSPGVPGTDAELTNLSLAGVFTATDFDADPVVIDAGASIDIENDVPENNGTVLAAKLVVEDGLTGLSTGIGGGPTTATFTAAELAPLVNSGADEPVTIKLNTALTVTRGWIRRALTSRGCRWMRPT